MAWFAASLACRGIVHGVSSLLRRHGAVLPPSSWGDVRIKCSDARAAI
jgi:hypothetical protein